jgi:hypothetical protein
MAEYDDNNRGAAFPPFPSQKLILQGKLNVDGRDIKCVLVKDQTKGGKNLIEVYQKIGVLFDNDKKGNESAPDYTGPIEFPRELRLAAWKKMANDKPYLSMNVSEKTEGGQGAAAKVSLEDDDDIPF